MTRDEYINKMRPELEALRDLPTPPRIYVIATGGCSRLQSTLWQIPGASAYMVGAQFPYATEATQEVLGFTPEHFVSPETAFALAHKAYYHALSSGRPETALGVGITCSAASLKEHRGEHHAWIAVVTSNIETSLHLMYGKAAGEQARLEDDFHIEVAALSLILNVCAKTRVQDPADLEASRKVWFDHPIHTVFARHDIKHADTAGKDVLFVPGAFNPVHEGHKNLVSAAAQASRLLPILSITANPPHKSHLTVPEMIAKVRHLRNHVVYFNQDPLFIDQARRFPGCSFAIGADALDRMLDPKWCPVSPMLAEFNKLGTRFYVGPRLIGNAYVSAEDVLRKYDVDNNDRGLFQSVEVPRLDISSTQLREQGKV